MASHVFLFYQIIIFQVKLYQLQKTRKLLIKATGIKAISAGKISLQAKLRTPF